MYCQGLEENLEAHREQLELIQSLSAQLMEKSRQDSLPRLLNRLKHVDSKWQHISERLTAKINECSDVSTRYSDFLSLIQAEEMFVARVETKLETGDDEAVDAEDMAAEMDQLESLLEEKNCPSSTLNDLAAYFKEHGILVEETIVVRAELEVKREEVINKAKERLQVLERASQKSQDTEVKFSQMELWMNEVNSLFRDWTAQDLLAGDLPDDFQTLKGEFDERDEFLESIEVQIKDFQTLGKTLAADRLQKKLDFIKDDYAIAQMNFQKWQRPIDFDPKFRRTQQLLHEIDDKIYLIEIYNEDPEHVGTRLEHCAKFYSTMSEIKLEVEYVIKTGRQLVEKKQVDFPRRVNQSLDALKSLYNRLGSKISQARKDLDKAYKISKVISKHTQRVRELVEEAENRLGSDILNLEDESAWIKMMESEFEKVHPSLAAIVSLYDQFEQFAEDSALDEAKESYEELKERWQSAIQSLAARSRTIAAQKSNADADFDMFAAKATAVLSQLKALKKSVVENNPGILPLEQHLLTFRAAYVNP
ncbi:dystrophin-like [Watersipora subatra]|uniref:dystrophin-like n=1 Tax=Watersipora subatra TaxID=2589382 RepID=UPI00355C79A7